jgi:hypothetical protein
MHAVGGNLLKDKYQLYMDYMLCMYTFFNFYGFFLCMLYVYFGYCFRMILCSFRIYLFILNLYKYIKSK